MIELYRGSVNTWECDEMGHMNVRFYVAKQMEGLAILAHSLDLRQAFRPGNTSTLLPFDQHIRFMKEVHPGRPIYMEGGILDVTDDAVLVYQELKHAVTGETAASFRTWVRHVESKTGKPFGWKQSTLDAFERLRVEQPAHTAPRSIDQNKAPLPDTETRIEHAEALGIPVIGRGAVRMTHCDSHGRMMPENFIGRVSDSVPNLLAAWRDEVAAASSASGEEVRSGAAVLEYRLRYRSWPRVGDVIEVRTGLGTVQPKVHSLVHWMLNPDTGEAYCTSEAVAVTFDLNTRKVIEANPEHMAMLEKRVPKGLSL